MVASRNVGLFSQATCCVACEYATVSSPFQALRLSGRRGNNVQGKWNV